MINLTAKQARERAKTERFDALNEMINSSIFKAISNGDDEVIIYERDNHAIFYLKEFPEIIKEMNDKGYKIRLRFDVEKQLFLTIEW